MNSGSTRISMPKWPDFGFIEFFYRIRIEERWFFIITFLMILMYGFDIWSGLNLPISIFSDRKNRSIFRWHSRVLKPLQMKVRTTFLSTRPGCILQWVKGFLKGSVLNFIILDNDPEKYRMMVCKPRRIFSESGPSIPYRVKRINVSCF